MRRRAGYYWRRITLLALVALLGAARLWYGQLQPDIPSQLFERVYGVDRAVDGDTLLLSNSARVRLLGIDTPETVRPDSPVEPFGPEASAFTKRFVSGGRVRITLDRERIDRYGRFLAYVWVGDRLLNEELVRAGLARVEPRARISSTMRRRLEEAQTEAQQSQKGIWSLTESASTRPLAPANSD